MTSDWLVLIRCAPGTAESARLRQWLQAHQKDSGLLFFQASGVEHANLSHIGQTSINNNFRMIVCQGSWQRRFSEPPPEPFAQGSLTEFFSRLDRSTGRLECFSAAPTR